MKPLSRYVVALLPALLLPIAARATPSISGSFTGTTSNAMTTGPDGRPLTLNGTPVAGSFSADATNCFPLDGHTPETAVSCGVSQDALAITASVNGQTFAFFRPGGLISVDNAAASQTLILTAGYGFEAFTASLILSGPANAFVSGTNFQTLRPGPIDLGASSLGIGARSSFSGGVQLASVSLNDVPVPVPEPAGWTMLAVGLLAAAVGIRFGRPAGRTAAAKG